jgi:ABC-type Fe3+ transport system substrate-binding protein
MSNRQISSLKGLLFLTATFTALLAFCFAAWAQTRIGKNLEEISRLAVQEGQVRLASALREDEADLVLKSFRDKYPMINVETDRIRGSNSREKLLGEALAGAVEYDVADISSELQDNFVRARVLAGPVQWRNIFPRIEEIQVSPDGYFVGVGFSAHVIAYNPSLVPENRIPKKWEDCLDPYWKGKFAVDTRPKTFAGLSLEWGEEKTLQYVRRLKENQPIWKRGQTEALTQLAAGEFPMICGSYYQSLHRIVKRDPKAKVAASFASPVSVGIGEALAVFKGAKSPNAAALLTGWLASPEGQSGYDKIGRGSPFTEGGEKRKLIEAAGAKIAFRGFEDNAAEEAIIKKIIAAWGFTPE